MIQFTTQTDKGATFLEVMLDRLDDSCVSSNLFRLGTCKHTRPSQGIEVCVYRGGDRTCEGCRLYDEDKYKVN